MGNINGRLVDDEEVIDFILENKKFEVNFAKVRMRRALKDYNEKLSEALEEIKKDLDDIERAEIDNEIENGMCDEWNSKVDEIIDEIEEKYDVDIEHEDWDVTITKTAGGLIIFMYSTVADSEAKNIEFEYELDFNIRFFVDLIEFMISKVIY